MDEPNWHWQIAHSLATCCWDANSNGRHKNEMLNSVWIQPAATWFWDSAKVTIAKWKMITVERQRMSYTRQRTLWFSVIPVWRLPFPVKPEVVAIWEIPSKTAWKEYCPRRQHLFTMGYIFALALSCSVLTLTCPGCWDQMFLANDNSKDLSRKRYI